MAFPAQNTNKKTHLKETRILPEFTECMQSLIHFNKQFCQMNKIYSFKIHRTDDNNKCGFFSCICVFVQMKRMENASFHC